MKVALLDVNALIALAWPNHVHHLPAREWFSDHHAEGWATCPLTESGFVRVSSSPRATSEAKTPAEALFLLQQIVALPGHTFWEDDISLAWSELIDPTKLVGYRQITDAHLVALAIRHGGKLVTFDRGMSQVVPPHTDAKDLLVLLD